MGNGLSINIRLVEVEKALFPVGIAPVNVFGLKEMLEKGKSYCNGGDFPVFNYTMELGGVKTLRGIFLSVPAFGCSQFLRIF